MAAISHEAAEPVSLHPIGQAPSTSFQNAAGVESSEPADPKAVAIAEWLRQRVANRPVQLDRSTLPKAKLAAQTNRLAQMRESAGGMLEARFRPENHTPFQIKGPILEKRGRIALNGLVDIDEQTARNFLRANRALLLIDDPDRELVFSGKEIDALGRRHLHFSQAYEGLPVWPCELRVHLDRNGDVDLMNGAFVPTPAGVGVRPAVSADKALDTARGELPPGAFPQFSEPELIIYGPLEGPSRLAWKFELSLGLTRAWRFVIDALNGKVLVKMNLVPHASEIGSGVDALGQTRPLNLWKEGDTHYLINTGKTMYDASSAPPDLKKTRGAIIILDAANTPPTSNPDRFDQILHVTSTSPNSGWTPDAVSAAFGLSMTYDYFLERHNRDSLDGKGGSIVGIVRLGKGFPNAYWDGQNNIMAFGDGYTKAFDVSGHELTHGVIDSVGAGGILVYHDQPGALNEALADIFGEMVEAKALGQPDWLKGNDLELADGAIQNYASPGSIEWQPGRRNPAKMSEFVQLPNTSEGDHGGVHINSSIINHAFYLLAQGMDQPIGLLDAEKIFYRTMTVHLQKQSQFIDMRHGCVASAEELFGAGSTHAGRTAAAFDLVEILDAPATPPPPSVPVVQGQDSTLFLRYFPFFDTWYLMRHEAAQSDDSQGQFIETLEFLAPRRIAVSGDGGLAVFVTVDSDLGLVNTDGTSPELLGMPGTIHSVAISPDGSRFAFILLDLFGNPSNSINIVELDTMTTRSVKLYAPGTEGAKLDIVQYADAMDFMADGQTLIYDAYSEIKARDDSFFGAWTLFALDIGTETISMLMDLSSELDFGNPSLGNTRNSLLTFEVIDKTTNVSSLFAGDLRTGQTAQIATMGAAGTLGVPSFTGDDRAIVYSQVDDWAMTGASLLRQPLADDGITPSGSPSLWMDDGAFGVIYRRGAYASANTPPQVALTSPASGQTFTAPATITLQATAADTDGAITRIEFYEGSTKLSEDNTPPYSFSVGGIGAGQYRFVARAVDDLGGVTDSTAVMVTVGTAVAPPVISAQPLNVTVLSGSPATFTVVASGSGTLSYQWKRDGADLMGQTAATLTLTTVAFADEGAYTVVVSNSAGSTTSSAAILTVEPVVAREFEIVAARITPDRALDLTFNSEAGQKYAIQVSSDLKNWSSFAELTASASTTAFRVTDTTLARRFCRIAKASPDAPGVPPGSKPVLTAPMPGQMYPEDTSFGGALFGVEFSIPARWKGGLKDNSSLFVFGSDTEPGIVFGLLTFAWNKETILNEPVLRTGLEMEINAETKLLFLPANPASPLVEISPDRLAGDFEAQTLDQSGNPLHVYLGLELIVHPSGGFMGFLGVTTSQYQGQLKTQLKAFCDTVKIIPRQTHTEFMNALNGRSFKWSGGGNDWYSNQPGVYSTSASLSSWGENYAFFCSSGTFEITSKRETIASATSPSSGYTGMSFSSTTKEYGQWTIVRTQEYGDLMLMVNLSGFQIAPVKVAGGDNLWVGEHVLQPDGFFNCE